MFNVNEILELQESTVARWHQSPIENRYHGFLATVCQQHQYNYELWHQEDIARSKEAGDAEIATVKRAIDRLNQLRNDWIEKLDDAITDELARKSITPAANARLNTETPGSAIDRLSIMALRIYHLDEQLSRTDVDENHLAKVKQRLELCRIQRADLGQSLAELIADIMAGVKRHRTYRQMKMYNDPTLNPYLYRETMKAKMAS